MILDFLLLPAVILVFITATALIISWDWRVSILCLGIQYLCVFVLISLSWPVETAAVKVVAGWMAGAVLGIALLNMPNEQINGKPKLISDLDFRLIAAILAGLGTGGFIDVKDGIRRMVRYRRSYMPNTLNAEVYDDLFRKYKSIMKRTLESDFHETINGSQTR